uniref:DNA replication complex GINS protein PSF1 n=1 Tax=Timema monikensis TaxID=170555 RepID=A0A7R9E1F5_9NEOP|nr:unnamed protein product [Timema monikensis]
MKVLFEENQKDVNMTVAGDASYLSGVHLRHAALERNKRCLLAYLYNRLKKIRQMRWEFGIVLPPEIRANLCEPERLIMDTPCTSTQNNAYRSSSARKQEQSHGVTCDPCSFVRYPRVQDAQALKLEERSEKGHHVCLPHDVVQWFVNYNKSLATYMKSIADSGGLNLTHFMQPPKSLYVEVRCLEDYGKLQLEDGEIVLLKKNTQHLLPRSQCELLIRQGILEHITS